MEQFVRNLMMEYQMIHTTWISQIFRYKLYLNIINIKIRIKSMRNKIILPSKLSFYSRIADKNPHGQRQKLYNIKFFRRCIAFL